jgi:hypothetical protein
MQQRSGEFGTCPWQLLWQCHVRALAYIHGLAQLDQVRGMHPKWWVSMPYRVIATCAPW